MSVERARDGRRCDAPRCPLSAAFCCDGLCRQEPGGILTARRSLLLNRPPYQWRTELHRHRRGFEQLAERHGDLATGEVRAEAEVHPWRTEGDVRVGVPGDVECVGVVEDGLIALLTS